MKNLLWEKQFSCKFSNNFSLINCIKEHSSTFLFNGNVAKNMDWTFQESIINRRLYHFLNDDMSRSKFFYLFTIGPNYIFGRIEIVEYITDRKRSKVKPK